MKKNYYFLLTILFVVSHLLVAQSTVITAGGQGNVRLPNLSYEQIKAIANPQAGMIAYDTTFKCLKYYNGTKWLCTTQSAGGTSATGFAWKKETISDLVYADEVMGITTDPDDNVYIVGIAHTDLPRSYIAKFSPNGTLLWEYTDTGYFTTASGSITIDKNRNVYAATSLGYGNSQKIKIFKLESNGRLAWAQMSESTKPYSLAYVRKIVVDDNQNVYLTGHFNEELSFGSLTLTSAAGNFNRCYVLKMNNSGSPLWLKAIKSGKVDINSSGEVYYAGYFSGTITIEATTLSSAGDEDILMARYTANGELAWVKRAGGSGKDRAKDLAIDNSGDVYVTGSFSGVASFDGTSANSADSLDFFVVKYRKDGTFQWLRNGGGTGADEGIQVVISPINQPVILGVMSSNSASFYPNTTLQAATQPANFLINYNDTNGDILWARTIESASGIALNALGNIYTVKSDFPQSSLSKYSGSGSLIYKQTNGGTTRAIAFGQNNNFFLAGMFKGTTQIGATTLVNTDGRGDIFVSHWME